MTRSENSAKNNRMSAADVAALVNAEARGEVVVSWHSRHIWNRLKNLISNDDDALVASILMRRHMHHVLSILAALDDAGMRETIVQWLHPEHAFYAIDFVNFDPSTATYETMIKTPGTSVTYARNAGRYVRIAIEALGAYGSKENRRQFQIDEAIVSAAVDAVRSTLHQGADATAAQAALDSALVALAEAGEADFRSRRLHRDPEANSGLLA
jgi:methylmalonyl-CoA mutase cobalamin-binding subunit